MEKQAQRPAAMRESRDIEWLLNWALEKQQAHIGGFGGNGHVGPAEVRSQLGSLGMKVDGGKGHADRRVVHGDAEIVWAKLEAMMTHSKTAEAAVLVFNHGRLGTQPDWGRDGCGRYILRRRRNGEGKAIKRFADPEHVRGLIGFEFEWVGHTVETLELMMVQYAAWHAALRELRDQVNTAMRSHVATGPVWMAEPWDDPVFIGMSGRAAMEAVD